MRLLGIIFFVTVGWGATFCEANSDRIEKDIRLLLACGFTREAKFELITIASNEAGNREDKITALLLLESIASSDEERLVILKTLCEIEAKYLSKLEELEADIQRRQAEKKLHEEKLKATKEAKLYLKYAKLWREKSQTMKGQSKDEIAESLYDYNELVESMEFCLSKALSIGHDSEVSHEAFNFYFEVMFDDLIAYNVSYRSLHAVRFENDIAKIVDTMEIYEKLYPDSPKTLESLWNLHDIFYRLAISKKIPRKRSKVKPEYRDFTYYGSAFDFYLLSLSWLDRIMEKSSSENFYSHLVRRKYRLIERQVSGLEKLSESFKLRGYDPFGPNNPLFLGVEIQNIRKMEDEIKRRVSEYPVLNIKVLEKVENQPKRRINK